MIISSFDSFGAASRSASAWKIQVQDNPSVLESCSKAASAHHLLRIILYLPVSLRRHAQTDSRVVKPADTECVRAHCRVVLEQIALRALEHADNPGKAAACSLPQCFSPASTRSCERMGLGIRVGENS